MTPEEAPPNDVGQDSHPEYEVRDDAARQWYVIEVDGGTAGFTAYTVCNGDLERPVRPVAWNEARRRRVSATMTTWGFIGSGNIGSTVARLALDAGDSVIMSNSRGPDTLAEVIAELGSNASAATAREAAAGGDVVVVTIPLKNYRDVPVDELDGKIVVDTMNYYPERDGHIEALDDESTTTSEMLQAHLRGAHVVKAFNNIYYEHLGELTRPSDDPDRSALAIAGDDVEAKATVTELFDSIGYDTVDLGPLAEGWRTQRDTSAYGVMYVVDPEDWTRGAKPADADTVRAAADSAKRYRDMV